MKEETTKKSRLKEQEELQKAAEAIAFGDFNIKEYYGLTDGSLEAMYSVGREMYSHKQYEKAKNVFVLLCMLDPFNSKYLSACATAHFLIKSYMEAAIYYRLALVNGEYTPKMLMQLAECTIKLNDVEGSINALTEIETLVEKNEKFQSDKESLICAERARLMKEAIFAEIEKVKSENAETEPQNSSEGQNNIEDL